MKSTFAKLASLVFLGFVTWFTTTALVSGAGKANHSDPVPAEEPVSLEGIRLDGPVKRARFQPQAWDDESAEMTSVAATVVEGAFARIKGSATVFSKTPGTKYFWLVKVLDSDGEVEDIVFDDTLAELPAGEVIDPSIDKILPLGSGEYKIRIRVQFVTPALAAGGLDNPILAEQCVMAEGECKVTVP